MLTLPAKFQTELDKGTGKPSIYVKIEEDVLEAEETSQADWTANTGENNVDYTTQPGDVILENWVNVESNDTSGTAFGPTSSTGQDIQAQGFKLSSATKVKRISLRLNEDDASATCKVKIYSNWSAGSGTLLGTSENVVVTTDAWYDFVFSSVVSLSASTQYHIILNHVSGNPLGSAGEGWYAGNSGYADGTYWQKNPGPGWQEFPSEDAYFRIYEGYQSSGDITTDEMDLGSTPTVNGEWQLSTIEPDDSSLTFEAWSSATGAFAGEEASLGTIVDGDAITDLKRYYKVEATFTANTNRDETPTLNSITAYFADQTIYTNNLSLARDYAYNMGLKSISSLATKIDDFSPSTIGQQTITFDFNESISKFLYSKFPKNKIVGIYIGFTEAGFTPDDHIEYFRGQISDYDIDGGDKVKLFVQNFQTEWERKVPEKWEDAGDDVSWTDAHHIDVSLDILQNYINTRDSKLVLSSFATVKASLSGYEVTRTITKQPVEAKKLLEELRILMSCYYIPQVDGKIKIKRYDSTEATVADITESNKVRLTYKGNLKDLINKTSLYYGWDGEGENASDFGDLDLTVNAPSETNWGETATEEIKDKWTDTADGSQITTLGSNIRTRYADPPSIISVITDKKLMALETGDMVAVTTKRAPSSDGISGITAKKFQIIQRNLDFMKDTLSLTLMEV